MRTVALAGLIAISTFVLALLIREGAQEKQNFNALFEVGGKALRDVAETTTGSVKVGTDEEFRIGMKIMRNVKVLPRSHPLTRRVQRVGARIAKQSRRQDLAHIFCVVYSPRFNAFALPGGFVIVTTGLMRMASTDAQLAWVLGHEVAHIQQRHALIRLRLMIAKRKLTSYVGRTLAKDILKLGDLSAKVMRLTYSENMELEADRLGLLYMLKADFLPEASLQLLDKVSRPTKKRQVASAKARNPFLMGVKLTRVGLRSYRATHPGWEQRRQRIQALLRKIRKKR